MKKTVFRSAWAGALALALFFSGLAGAGANHPPAAGTYRIVTLGDSLAVGYEPGMTEKSLPYGYAERLYEQALFHGRAKQDNYGIIGLRTKGLLNLLQGAADGKKLKASDIQDFTGYEESARLIPLADATGARTAELKASLAGADLVVITIGANDFSHFLTSLVSQSMDNVDKSLHVEFPAILDQYTSDAEKVIRQLGALAPDAQILLSDQYLPLPKLLKGPEIYEKLYENAVTPLTSAVDALTAKLQGEGLKVGSVHIADSFKGQEGSMTHMSVDITGSDNKKPDNHPKQEGYEAIAKAFAEAVWKEYRKPAKRPKDVPISVVVAGKELITPNKPVIKKPGVTFLALRDISDAMGAELLWNDKTKTATFRQNGREVSITIDAKTMVVNGESQPLSSPAFLHKVGKEKKTYVPLAVIATGLSYKVDYSQKLQTAFINP